MLIRVARKIKQKIRKKIHKQAFHIYKSLRTNTYDILDDYRVQSLQNGIKLRYIPKIVFYVSLVSHIDHYKRIWRNLSKDDFIILIPTTRDDPTTFRERPLIIKYLSNENIYFKSLECALAELEQYSIFVTMFHDNSTDSKLCHIAQFYVRYMIQGLESYSYNPKAFTFSLFLCQSDYQLQKVKEIYPSAQCEIMGYPRMDDYFNQSNLPIEIEKYNLKGKRKTILYLPTHAGWGMLKSYLNILFSLSDTYNVIIKPHPACFTEDAEFLAKFNDTDSFHIVKESIPEDWAFFKIADYVFVDRGGSGFAAIYAKKNIVFLFDENTISRKSDGLEERLGSEFLSIKSPNEKMLRELLSSNDLFESKKNVLEKYRDKFFTPFSKNSGVKAAKILSIELSKLRNMTGLSNFLNDI